MQVLERDWKIYRQKMPIWQENYMAKLVNEYVELLNHQDLASQKFWQLEKRIYKDKKSLGVVVNYSRSQMFEQLIELLINKIITKDDLIDFSQELKDEIDSYLNICKITIG